MILDEHENNFVRVARKIKEMAKNMDREKINRLTSNQGINWRSFHQEHRSLVGFSKAS